MPQVVAALALDRGPRVQRVHLVDAHAVQPLVMRLEHVDQADRLAVGHRHDQVGVAAGCDRAPPRRPPGRSFRRAYESAGTGRDIVVT